MKSNDAELLAKLISERLKSSTAIHEKLPNPAVAKADEEKLLQLRRLFDRKYNVLTPPELMKT